MNLLYNCQQYTNELSAAGPPDISSIILPCIASNTVMSFFVRLCLFQMLSRFLLVFQISFLLTRLLKVMQTSRTTTDLLVCSHSSRMATKTCVWVRDHTCKDACIGSAPPLWRTMHQRQVASAFLCYVMCYVCYVMYVRCYVMW